MHAVWELALRNSQRFAARGRMLTGYAYPIEGQGRCESLRVIGDQDRSTLRLRLDPEGGPAGLEPGMTVWSSL